MLIKVFLSTGFRGETKESIETYCKNVIRIIRNEYEYLRDDDEIQVVHNFDEEIPEKVGNRKLYLLAKSFEKMADCDFFFLLKEKDGSVKPGCMTEMTAWMVSGGCQPIVRQKK